MSASSFGRRCAAVLLAVAATVLGPKRCLSMYVDQPS